ncbi:TPA: hypothetical protein QDB07_001793 [Burkholderia vietnamiensis]|nr:hypothetical protein [Burkholderia vietnamiensis]
MTFKKHLPGNLQQVLVANFRRPSMDIATCAAGTALDGLTMLSRVKFAENSRNNNTAFFYIEEDVSSLSIHIERRSSTQFSSVDNELKEMKNTVDTAIAAMKRFAKDHKNRVKDFKISISCGDAQLVNGRHRGFPERFKEGLKATLAAKATTPFATGLVGFLVTADAGAMAKAFLTGIVAVVVASILEAVMAESFKYERS